MSERVRLSRIRTQALALGVIPVGFLLLLLAAVGLLRLQTESAVRWVQHSDHVLGIERKMTSSLIRASNGLAEYMRHPDAANAAALESNLRTQALASELRASVRDNPAQERRAVEIARLSREFSQAFSGIREALDAHDRRKIRAIEADYRARGLSAQWEAQTSAFEHAETALRTMRWDKLRSQERMLDWVLGGGALMGIALTLLSAFGFGRRIVGRLERLSRNARTARDEQPLPDVIEGNDEIAELDREYHDMAAAMREREAQLHKYRLLAEHARDVILFIRRSDGRILDANAAAAQAYGYSMEELLTLRAADLRTPEAAVRLAAELDRAQEAPIMFETVHRRKDGHAFPVEIAAQSALINGEPTILEIVRDITERRLAQQELRAALNQAVDAARLKSQFLATMSHEIRTPLNAVIGMTELLLHSRLDDDQRHCALVAHDSGETLLHLINDILDFSKLEAQRIDLELIEFRLVPLVEGVAGVFASQAARNCVALMTYVNPRVPQALLGDPNRLRQVLTNLAGNAVKFTQNGSVVVSADLAQLDGDAVDVLFSVTDTGIGMAPETTAALFEPFRQGDGSMARRFGGTGLGLSISKGLVELMGGSIDVQSRLGAGSTFSFTLTFKTASGQRHEPPDLSEMRALVIDDDAIAREIFSRYLTSWKMRCDAIGDPIEACGLAETANAQGDPYDLVVVDLVLPQMDGFELARRLKGLPGTAETRLIMVTAYDEPERGKAAIAAGFSAYLTKPVRQSQLYDCIVNASSGAAGAAAPALHESRSQQRRILIAEDNSVNREVALRQLGKLGYAAQAVSDGRQAVEAALSGQFDVVLMDCQMPHLDGFDATRAIRKGEARSGSRVRIIAMTANAMSEDRQACLDAGMDDYIAKPVTLESLARVLAAGPSDAFDVLRLHELFEGDAQEMTRFLESALPALLSIIERLETSTDAATRLGAAHELRGAAANIGALEIAELAAQIESRLRSGASDGVAPLAAQLHEAYERALGGARALEFET